MNIPHSAPQHVWQAAGYPEHKYREEDCHGVCATCAVEIERGVPTTQINNKTFSGHAEFFRYGTHVCSACAWLYGAGKGKPGNILAHGDTYVRPVLSPDSADGERLPWAEVLRNLGSPVAGVLTTDTKPRLWPRMRLATTEHFGLYIHTPDYGVSEYRSFGLAEMLAAVEVISGTLAHGFSKHRVYHGLMHDYQRFSRDPKGTMRLDSELETIRGSPEFVPALLISHKHYAKANATGGEDYARDRSRGDALGSLGGREARGGADQDHARLF